MDVVSATWNVSPRKMRLATFIILSSLSYALSTKSGEENEYKAKYYAKNQTSNYKVRLSDKDEQLLFTSIDNLEEKGLRNSDEIAYIRAKEMNRTENRIQREFLNSPRISASFTIAKPTKREKENEENGNKRMENIKFDREEESLTRPFNNADVKNNIPKSLNNAKNNTPQRVKLFEKQIDDDEKINTNFNKNDEISSVMKEHSVKNSDESLIGTMAQNADSKIENQTLESRTKQENLEPAEDDLMEAANFGLQAMHKFYYIEEPKLYSMGLYLGHDNPARYVAAFNDQSKEARELAKFGYAVLQSTAMFLKKFPNAPLELPLSRTKFTQRTLLEQQCPQRDPPQCPAASLRYRTSDGSCNNLQNLWWGSAMSAMQRFLPPEYDDGVQSIRRSKNGRPLPSARDITSVIHQSKDIPLASVTHMLMQWGQFVDHDLTATGQSRGFNGSVPQCCLPRNAGFQPPEFMHPECLPIAVNQHDDFYGPLGVRCLEFLRSGPAPKEGCKFGPREQLSQVTSYLDASTVYSSNAVHSDSLRIFRNGLLQYGRIQSRRPLLPKRESDLCKRGSLSTTCFRAGDGRLSEQPALTSLHVVFLRLHNRIATQLSALNSHWSDEKLFQETRRIVGAIIQHITYREFLPIVLGPQVMKIFDLEVLKKGYYEGYDPTINPTIANAFSTAAYRFGHSLVQHSFVRFNSNHKPIFNNVSIHDEFSNPGNLETAGSVDRLLLGLVNQPCQRRDEFITEEITNHLFQTPGFAFGMDLASLNIQRGRDHGLPPFVRWREPCSLSPIKSFQDLDRVMSPEIARKFRSLYASVEDIDLFSAGLAEKSVAGGLVGPTFACIIGQQFSNLRHGDRFWYENSESESSFTPGQLQQIRRITLAQVLCRTMDGIETIQPFVFLTTDTLKNQRLSCDDPIIGQLNLEFWAERPSEFRRVDDSQKIKAINISDSKSKGENVNLKRKVDNQEQAKIIPQSPFKGSVTQENKIVIKRPFGRPDSNNVTIVVQNNAVNSPVFVNEGIYGSHVKIQQPVTKPTLNLNQAVNNYHGYRPPANPIPTTIPHSVNFHSASQPYIPHAFDDPNNPNPLAYGYKSPAFAQDDVFYDNYSPTSPRPTLYTYYTNFQQKYTTQMPNHEVDGYLINHGPSYNNPDSFSHTYERPKPLVNSQHHYELNDKQSTQKPDYANSKFPANAWPNFKPNYASNDESYYTRKTSYDGYKFSTTVRPNFRPNFRPNYQSNNEASVDYEPSVIDYNKSKPLVNSQPDDVSYKLQKPVYGGPLPPANLRPDSKPNYQSYGTQRPDNEPENVHNDNLDKKPNNDYQINLNKSHYQEQSNNYHVRPSERPYDYDDPDAYHKRPNVKLPSYNINNSPQTASINRPNNEYNSQLWKKDSLESNKDSLAQDGLYGSIPNSGTSTFSYQKDTPTKSSISSSTNHNNYDRYSNNATLIFQKIPSSTQSSWIDVSSYITESSTRPLQGDSFNSHNSPSNQKLTNYPIYQKDNQSPLSLHSKESIHRPLTTTDQYNKYDNSYKNPTKLSDLNGQLLSSTPYWLETSTISSQAYKKDENFNPKPTKVQSVTIVTETLETVHNPGHSGYISQHTVTSESPRPLVQRIKNVPIIQKPGQYYYEKNVLYRYPDEIIDQIPKSNRYSAGESEKAFVQNRQTTPKNIAMETSTINDSINSRMIQSNANKLTTIPDYNNNKNDMSDLQRTLSIDVENIAPADVSNRMNHWMNPQEDLNLPSIVEMPEISSNKFTDVKELPKPIIN
ncbi:uncharacterized protein [Anoplolepis gracilipes]|uniref:uncharacterized protein isoform X1 n=1 Tax=Anoplolepis gracilipes TaxID=354296 RepID=UPI003B9F2B4E